MKNDADKIYSVFLFILVVLLPFSFKTISAKEAVIFFIIAIFLFIFWLLGRIGEIPPRAIALIFVLITTLTNRSFFTPNALIIVFLILSWLIRIRKGISQIGHDNGLEVIIIFISLAAFFLMKIIQPILSALIFVYVANVLTERKNREITGRVLVLALFFSGLLATLAIVKSDYYMLKGQTFKDAGDLSKAVEYFKKSVVLQAENANTHLLLAKVYFESGQTVPAVVEFERTIGSGILRPQEMSEVYYKLGKLYLTMRKWDKAFDNYQKTIRLIKNKNIVLNNRIADDHFFTALHYESSGLLDEAIMEYRKHLNELPDNAAARYSLAKILSVKDYQNQAINEYEMLISQNANNVNYHIGIADIYKLDSGTNMVQHQNLINAYEKILKIQPFNIGASDSLVKAYMKIGLREKAKILSQEIIKRHPFSPTGYLYYADSLLEANDFENAEKFYKKALFLAPREISIIIYISDNYIAANRCKEARHILCGAVRAFPHNKELNSRVDLVNACLPSQVKISHIKGN